MGQRGVVNSLPPHEQGFEHSENRLPAPPRGSRPEGPARKVGPADGSQLLDVLPRCLAPAA